MSAAGKNYRSLIDDDGECSSSSSVMNWTISSKTIENTVSTIRELIDVRDGYKECIGICIHHIIRYITILNDIVIHSYI